MLSEAWDAIVVVLNNPVVRAATVVFSAASLLFSIWAFRKTSIPLGANPLHSLPSVLMLPVQDHQMQRGNQPLAITSRTATLQSQSSGSESRE
jgi:hypothetical protein